MQKLAGDNLDKNKLEQAWYPDPRNKPQVMAYECDAFEILYGGGVGGGKTEIILGKPIHKHTRALLLRRTFPEVERSFIQRAFEIYGNFGDYNSSKHIWSIGSRQIEFGHIENCGSSITRPGDAQKYAGAPYDFIGFDQLEHFPKHVYEFMLSRVRTVKVGQKQQVISTANPVGEYVDWIIQHWAAWLDETYSNPAKPGEIRWFKRDASGKEVETDENDKDAVSRTFIPAKLKDNPYLGDDYRRTINLLPEPIRTALLEGDWKSMITDDAYQLIPREWVRAAMSRWRNMQEPKTPITSLGADLSRGGEDKSVIAERRDNWFATLRKYPGYTIRDGQAFIEKLIGIKIGNAPINMDVISIGSSPYDLAKEKYNAIPINWANRSDKTDRSGKFKFANKRAEHWWKFREALDPEGGADIALPDDPELLGDLCAPRYKIQSSGILIESKDEIKKRLGRSPDCGDAVVLAYAEEQRMTVTSVDVHTIEDVMASIGLTKNY